MNNQEIVKRNLQVINDDIEKMFKGNTAVAFNPSGEKGFIFYVNYDGRAWVQDATAPDNIGSLYEESYKSIIDRVFKDVIGISFLEKGNRYREDIINEVNIKAVAQFFYDRDSKEHIGVVYNPAS